MIPHIGELLTSGSALDLIAGVLLLGGGAAFALCAVALSFVDLAEHRLPNRILYPWGLTALGVLVAVTLLTGALDGLMRALAAALIWGGAFLLIRLAHPPSIGMGDVKLVAVLALYTGFLGWTTVLAAVVLAFLLGGLVAAGLLITRRAGRRSRIPFGPFLILGAAIALIIS
ncbi:A24 family peptidase [Nesterenkonia halobia]|uniref:Prepilin type IV endopeptidase peptidase domain-containing protein n=1 Tax=Nesterenkonia halobia TaxID=37922 RepID=A0ABP6RFT5_9MICC